MSKLIDHTDLLIHAADIIELQAKDIHMAFAMSDGRYHSIDQDLEIEVRDMNETAKKLKKLTKMLVGRIPLF